MPSNKDKRVALGLDIGGTDIKAVAVELPFRILAEATVPSRASESPSAVFEALAEVVAYFTAQEIQFEAVGSGCAGSIDSDNGIVRNSPNFAGWKNVPLGPELLKITGVRSTVDNDANCAAYGEWAAGDHGGTRNMVFLTLGTGIGGGLILDRRLFRGSTGTAGELGHMSIHADGEICPCGNRGCFERYCSGSAIASRAGCSPKVFFEQLAGNSHFQGIFGRYLSDLTIGLVNLGNLYDPDVMVLGGAVSAGLVPYLERLDNEFRRLVFPAVAGHMKLTFAKHGNRSGAIGAALLALVD